MACRRKSASAPVAAPALAEPLTVRTALRAVAFGGFVVYLGWNAAWLLCGQAAPSLLLALCGIPAPTTGMGRALAAAQAGNWPRSLAYNPCLLPTLLLLALTCVQLVWRQIAGRPRRLSPWLALAWAMTLGLAWLWTLGGGRFHPENLWRCP